LRGVLTAVISATGLPRRVPISNAIWDYIAADNPDAADALLHRIGNTLRMLADNPRAEFHFRLATSVTANRTQRLAKPITPSPTVCRQSSLKR
jgi:hypothetical protein